MQILKSEIRQRILDAAVADFASKGFLKTSMREIAAEVGIRAGNIYHYFPSKDILLRHILEPLITELYSLCCRHNDVDNGMNSILDRKCMSESVLHYCHLIEKHRVLMEILLFKTQGSSLSNFKSDFTDFATTKLKEWIRYNQEKCSSDVTPVNDFIIHLHTVQMYSLVEEILMHDIMDDELKLVIEQYVDLELFGWKSCFRLCKEV